MEKQKRAIEKKYEILKDAFNSKKSFNVDDAQKAWNAKKSTTYWDLSNLVEQGYLSRLQRGKFSVNLQADEDLPIPSGFAQTINLILQETGFQYFISGLDVLLRYMQHIPDHYPVMLFVDKFSKEEIEDILIQNNIHTVYSQEINDSNFLLKLNKMDDIVILYETQSFSYSSNGYASNEKAFVDLYFEITRHNFPLALQELSRIYSTMYRRGVIDKSKLLKAAHERNIRADLRLIIDIRHIHSSAFTLANMIKGDLNNV